MTAGAAADVGDGQAAHVAEQFVQQWLFQGNQGVAFAIVDFGSAVVAFAGRHKVYGSRHFVY